MSEFHVGDRVSMQHVADRYPGTVIEVGKREILVREDSHRRREGAAPYTQDWIIEENPDGPVRKFTLRKDGRWRGVGSTVPILGHGWSYYHSYEF